MLPFEQPIPDGYPWIDYQEATKTGTKLLFTFRIESLLRFILRNIIITYPSAAGGNAQPQLFVQGNISSTQNLFQPIPIPPEMFSSPSQNFRQGALNEAATYYRTNPVYWQYPFDKGDTFIIQITGSATGMVIGCTISGRKITEELNGR